jgi:AraC-like DNA-binding protein
MQMQATPSRTPSLHRALLGAPGRQLFASRDLHETRAMVSRVMKPHQLDVHGGAQRLDARMHHAALGDVSISRLRHGADVDIAPGALDDFFLVMMPLQGQAEVACGTERLDSWTDVASVLSPHLATHMRWSADCDQLMVRIARPFMERMLAAQLGHALDRPLTFALGFRWRESPAWQCLLHYLVDCAEQPVSPTEHKLVLAHIEQLVAATLLATQPHNYGESALPRRSAVLPRHVRRVQDYLQAHAHEPVHAEALAEIAGVSLRSLYAGFKDFCGMSPMQYLRDLRLDRCRSDLLAGGAGSNVAGVALRWGFGHLGRFSADYKARFGEHPSETLRRH